MKKYTAFLELPEAYRRALVRLLECIPPEKFSWVLIGSAGLRLHGVDLPVHDLDLQTDLETIARIEQRLSDCMTVAVHLWESPGMRSMDGKAEIEGIQVELLANIAHRLTDGSWGSFTDFSRVEWAEMQGLSIPTFPLEDELAAYIAMGRNEKAALIRKTIESLGK